MDKRNPRGIQFLRTSSSSTPRSSIQDASSSRSFLGSMIRPFSPPTHEEGLSQNWRPNGPFYAEHAQRARSKGGHRTGPKDSFSSSSRQFSVSNGTRKLLKRSVSGSSSSPGESLRNVTSGSRTGTLGPRRSLEGNHLTHPPPHSQADHVGGGLQSSSPPSPLSHPSPHPQPPPLVHHAMNQKKRSFPGPIRKTAQPYRRKTEKSTAILLGIILVFISCHVLRFR